jgi:hypothetical protein
MEITYKISENKNKKQYYGINYPETYFVDEKTSEPGKKVVLVNRSHFMESLIPEYFDGPKNDKHEVKKILQVIKTFEKLYKLVYVYNQGYTIDYYSIKDLERTYYVIIKEIMWIEDSRNGSDYMDIRYRVTPHKLTGIGGTFNFPGFMVFFEEEIAEAFLKDNINDIRLVGNYMIPVNVMNK